MSILETSEAQISDFVNISFRKKTNIIGDESQNIKSHIFVFTV